MTVRAGSTPCGSRPTTLSAPRRGGRLSAHRDGGGVSLAARCKRRRLGSQAEVTKLGLDGCHAGVASAFQSRARLNTGAACGGTVNVNERFRVTHTHDFSPWANPTRHRYECHGSRRCVCACNVRSGGERPVTGPTAGVCVTAGFARAAWARYSQGSLLLLAAC
eukprot:4685272-Prymnesium_polylepis.1